MIGHYLYRTENEILSPISISVVPLIMSHMQNYLAASTVTELAICYTGLHSFFSDRTHRTRVVLCLSDVAVLMSGVVQGSGAGPMLFLIYIDDLAKLFQRYGIAARLFADDVKVYLEITGHEDVVRLQKALDVITAWASEWQLSVSVSKCNILTVGPSCYEADYYVSGIQLLKCATCRNLGVTITSDLTPTQHIHDIVLKAHQRANHIIRCFISGYITLLVKAFTVYVRPILEYNSVILSPCTKKEIDQIEKVEWRFTKRLHGFKNFTYEVRLVRLGIPSLELHRLHLDLIYRYKLVFVLICLGIEQLFAFSPVSATRGHAYKLYKPQCANAVRKNFFTERVVNVWNSLPHDVDLSSLSKFRCSINQVDFSQFLRCMEYGLAV